MRQALGTIAVLAIIFGIFCYANGWLTFSKNSATTTIELKTGEIRDAADRAVEKGQEIIEESTTTQPVATDAQPTPTPVVPTTPQPAPLPATPEQSADQYNRQSQP